MVFNWNFKRGIYILIILAIAVNTLSYIEAKIRNVTEAKYVIVFSMFLIFIYLLISGIESKSYSNRLAYFSALPVTAMEFFNRLFSLYELFPLVDIIAHFLGGFALAAALYFGVKLSLKKVIIWSIFGAFIWELGELIFDVIFPIINSEFFKDPFFWDGFTDIITQLVGMFIIVILVDKKNIKQHI
ncbi:hypothetical protein HYT56_04745 [Candidatus Woesearchaeota archaeon]|nr:hypothetical protein [Candidatus Woesearchaeota archaeon]